MNLKEPMQLLKLNEQIKPSLKTTGKRFTELEDGSEEITQNRAKRNKYHTSVKSR